MPIITVEAVGMDRNTKDRFIKEITDKASEVTGIPQKSFTIIIHENGYENFGIGGQNLADIVQK